MSSSSYNDEEKTTSDPNFFFVPKYSWETESHCDEFTQEIPTYSWELDTCTPLHSTDSCSSVVPESQLAPNIDHANPIEAEQPSQLMENSYTTYDGSTSAICKDHSFGYEFAQSPEKANLDLDVDAIKSELCDGFIDSPPMEEDTGFEFAQSPDKPNINIDVDAIKRELCDGIVYSPQKKKKGKNIRKWF